MSAKQDDLTERLLEEFELSGALDRMDEAVLGAGVRQFGVDGVTRLLLGYAAAVAEPFAPPAIASFQHLAVPSSLAARRLIGRSAIEQFIIDNCRRAYDDVEVLIRELDWRLEPAVLGDVPVRPDPWGIAITRLGRLDRCGWASGRAAASLRLALLAEETDDPFAVAVSTRPADAGNPVRVEIDTEKLARLDAMRREPSAAGKWRAGYLVNPATGWGDPDREVVCLRWDPPTGRRTGPPQTPAGLVRDGFVAEAWAMAVQIGFSDREVIALQMLITSQMRMMLDDEAPRHGFGDELKYDVIRCQGELDARQQSLCEHVQQLFLK